MVIPSDENRQSPSIAGWYPDPYNPQNQRYWDGKAWTAASLPKGPSTDLASQEIRHRRRTRLIVALGLMGVLLAAMAIVSLQFVARPILLDQAAEAADTQAKADASTLGRNISFYFVDHIGPPPQITVIDGEYRIIGADPPFDVEVVGEGVVFGGVTGTNSTNWCVWVTHPDGDAMDHRYSAIGGLEQGRC